MTNMDYQHQHQQQQQQQQEKSQPLDCHQPQTPTSESATPSGKHPKVKLSEINPYLTCQLCKGYLIDATTISECLHSFCRSCIVKFLRDKSHCPVCEVLINKAKPNLKLDKTLQDVVYKLVPELFLNEMRRRQAFYQKHPQQASLVSPEQRGEDTERTIFNPQDTFSLSLEYISDDSTPGAILLPSTKVAGGKKKKNGVSNAVQKETENMMKRFLQCSGMCRVDVLKKFVRNKYNVDTFKFHIDILYKRVPLPDHYTLIDIAYIYSWKRNEPMKFFFRITDIRLVKERFDYLEPTASLDTPTAPQQPPTQQAKTNVRTGSCSKPVASAEAPRQDIVPEEQGNKKDDDTTNTNTPAKNKITEAVKKVGKNGQLVKKIFKDKNSDNNNKCDVKKDIEVRVNGDDSNVKKVESRPHKIATPKQQVQKSDEPPKLKPQVTRNPAEPLKLKIVNSVKSPKPPKLHPEVITKTPEPIAVQKVEKPKALKEVQSMPLELDAEKEHFLKCIELTSRNSVESIIQAQKKEALSKPVLPLSLKRKLPSPQKPEKSAKKLKSEKKTPGRKPSKLDKKAPVENLKTLLNTCKIPSSLSITCVNGDHETQIKPVINHIEILKLPETKPAELDEKKQKKELEKVGTTMKPAVPKEEEKAKAETKDKSELSITITVENVQTPPPKKEQPKGVGVHPNLPKMLDTPVAGGAIAKSNSSRLPYSFQKMFEEAIKRPENEKSQEPKQKVQKVDTPKKSGMEITATKSEVAEKKNGISEAATNPIPKATTENPSPTSSHKRNILEIASQLSKRSKMEQEKKTPVTPEGKVAIPRLNTHKTLNNHKKPIAPKPDPSDLKQTVTNLQSPNLGMSYSVSVSQKQNHKHEPSKTALVPSPKASDNLTLHKPYNSPKSLPSPKLPAVSPKTLPSPKHPSTSSPKPAPALGSPKPAEPQKATTKAPFPKSSPKENSKPSSASSPANPADPNHLLEKYNIQNLAQLTANFNFPSNLSMAHANQLAAFQQAMVLRHLEMQNRQSWLSMNANPLVQYEKYIQSLGANGQGHLLGNIKEN